MNFLGYWYYYLGMKTIYNIYEGILDDIDTAIDKADRTVKDIRKRKGKLK